jgi:hypothetical protein
LPWSNISASRASPLRRYATIICGTHNFVSIVHRKTSYRCRIPHSQATLATSWPNPCLKKSWQLQVLRRYLSATLIINARGHFFHALWPSPCGSALSFLALAIPITTSTQTLHHVGKPTADAAISRLDDSSFPCYTQAVSQIRQIQPCLV